MAGLVRTIAAALALLALAVPIARAHDSLAPPGLDYHSWLPHEDWVMKHWLPFDEARLRELLGVDTADLFNWLANDHRTLAQLAQRHGVNPRTLARRLLAGRRAEVGDRVYAILLDRTKRTLTQGHLAQHMFFHVFHGADLVLPVRRYLGVSPTRWRHLRYERGWPPARIAESHGRSVARLRAHALHELAVDADQGVAHGASSRAEADEMLARQERGLDCWLSSPPPKMDPRNPFGDPDGGHGHHHRGSHVGIKHPKPPRGCWRGLYAGR
jgi:hypothetical protein